MVTFFRITIIQFIIINVNKNNLNIININIYYNAKKTSYIFKYRI
jgi:hypothetical protein